MLGRDKRLLGISIGERGLLVAEVVCEPDAPTPTRVAELVYPAGITLENPAALGKTLASFLASHNYSARRVIFGVPARWLIVRPHSIPPADSSTAAEMLWLHASQHISSDLGEMVFDFIGESSTAAPTTLLLVGLQKQWMNRLLVLCEAARLKPMSITPTGAALAAATSPHVDQALIVSLSAEGAELSNLDGGQLKSLRHVGPSNNLPLLIAELRRASAASHVGSASHSISDSAPSLATGFKGRSLVLWNDAGLDQSSIDALRSAVEHPLVEAQSQWVDAVGVNLPEGGKGLSVLALTLPARAGEQPAVDFLHSRIAPPTTARFGRGILWAAAVAAVILLAILVGAADIAHLTWRISSVDNDIALLDPAYKTAKPFVARMQFAESFKGGSPRYLACVRDLTTATSPDGLTYFSSLTLGMDMKGQVFGKSDSEQSVLSLMDKLKASGRFGELKCSKLDTREAAGQGKLASFSATFIFKPVK